MLALALWQAGEVLLWWHGLLDPEHRMRTALVCTKCLAKALVYAVLGITALLFAMASSTRPTSGCASSPTTPWGSRAAPC